MNAPYEDFSQLLKSWRNQYGVSQLELSLRCDVSQKHISFLESKRSAPSHLMVQIISEALEIPLRNRNSLLMSAGFAPFYKESDLSEPELAAVDQALSMMLDQHEPYPAVVVDHLFNLIRANRGAMKLQSILFGVDDPAELPGVAGNILRGLISPDGYREHVKNWNEIVPCLLRRLQSELYTSNGSAEIQALLDELSACDGVPSDWRHPSPGGWNAPILTVDIEKDGIELSFFSTIATLGTPQDITLQEIRVESYFPANDATRMIFAAT